MESEEEGLLLFRSYPLYLVHSPAPSSNTTTTTHANANANANANNNITALVPPYSSSSPAPSNNSFSFSSSSHFINNKHHLLIQFDHHAAAGTTTAPTWIKYFSLTHSNSGWWILMQLSWRFLVSFMVALLVFYVAAKPPPPHLSLKVARIGEFRLGEGVDASGVTTKILSCNISIDVIIDNHSNLFALHIHPPIIQLMFAGITFAISRPPSNHHVMYAAGSNDLTMLRFKLGTKNKAMYGAGRNMQDFLESGKGLSLVIRVGLRSRFNVIWGVFQPRYHHEPQCLVLLLDDYDQIHRTQVFNSTYVLINVKSNIN